MVKLPVFFFMGNASGKLCCTVKVQLLLVIGQVFRLVLALLGTYCVSAVKVDF